MARKKLLIIQGGGIFGCIPATFLGNLPVDIRTLNGVDMLAGCSIGGILALCYASGHSFKVIEQKFQDIADACFQKRFWARINPVACPTYDRAGLDKVLKELLEDKTLEYSRKEVWPNLDIIIPSLDVTNDHYKVFDNITGQDCNNLKMRDMAAYTSAAPSYYSGVDYKGSCMIDGGVIEVAPLLTAATALRAKRGVEFKDMDVLIVGTGKDVSPDKLTTEVYNGLGLIGIAQKVIVPYVTLSNQMATIFWGQNLGFNSFEYFNPVETDGAMDDTEQIPGIITKCKKFHKDFECAWRNWMKPE